MDSQSLFDTLSGAVGAPVNRPALNNFVATSQALNGLRSAQTDEALLKAQKARDEMEQDAQLKNNLSSFFGSGHEAEATLLAGAIRGGHGDLATGMEGLLRGQQFKNRGTLSDPSLLGTPEQTAAQQGVEGKVATPVAVPETYTTLPGAAAPNVMQTPQGEAHTAETNARANLANRQADDPELFHPQKAASQFNLTPEQGEALGRAVHEGRLDPYRINSRTASIFATMEMNNPGGNNFNGLSATNALNRNATFRQKAMSADLLPGVLTHMVSLGKAVGYSDVKFAGRAQKWMKGEVNDPALTEYMTVRNDALLRLAGVMRQVGMSDKAHAAEIEAADPHLAPYALDAWLKGQMSVLTPLLEQQRRVTQQGEPAQQPGGPAPAPAPGAPPAAPPAGGAPVQIKGDDEYNALPSGTPFIDPQGKRRVKP